MRPEDGSHRRQDPLRASRGGGSHRRAMRSAPRESGMRPSSARSGSPLPESLRPGPVTSRPPFDLHAPRAGYAGRCGALDATRCHADCFGRPIGAPALRFSGVPPTASPRRSCRAARSPRRALRKRGTATALHRRSVPQRVVRVRHRSGIRKLTAPRCRPRFHPARRRGQLPVPLRGQNATRCRAALRFCGVRPTASPERSLRSLSTRRAAPAMLFGVPPI